MEGKGRGDVVSCQDPGSADSRLARSWHETRKLDLDSYLFCCFYIHASRATRTTFHVCTPSDYVCMWMLLPPVSLDLNANNVTNAQTSIHSFFSQGPPYHIVIICAPNKSKFANAPHQPTTEYSMRLPIRDGGHYSQVTEEINNPSA